MRSDEGGRQRYEAVALVAYFIAYLSYLFFLHREGEALRWVSLVVGPLALIGAIGRYRTPRAVFDSIGLDPANAARGWPMTIAFIIAFEALQLMNSAQRATLLVAVHEPLTWLLLPGTAILLVGTAANTEEVFFRGLLQTRVARVVRNEGTAILIVTFAFVLYHVPFAYARPGSGTEGNLAESLRSAAGNAVIAGVPIGMVFWRSRHNLYAAMALHAAIDLIPALLLLRRIFG
jgi:membrane protease YdiL (CAAX protease family)